MSVVSSDEFFPNWRNVVSIEWMIALIEYVFSNSKFWPSKEYMDDVKDNAIHPISYNREELLENIDYIALFEIRIVEKRSKEQFDYTWLNWFIKKSVYHTIYVNGKKQHHDCHSDDYPDASRKCDVSGCFYCGGE